MWGFAFWILFTPLSFNHRIQKNMKADIHSIVALGKKEDGKKPEHAHHSCATTEGLGCNSDTRVTSAASPALPYLHPSPIAPQRGGLRPQSVRPAAGGQAMCRTTGSWSWKYGSGACNLCQTKTKHILKMNLPITIRSCEHVNCENALQPSKNNFISFCTL